MQRVEHLRRLASMCRNMAATAPAEEAADLRKLATSYEHSAAQREHLIETGLIDPVDSAHPGQPAQF